MKKGILTLLSALVLFSCNRTGNDNAYRQFIFTNEYRVPGSPTFVYDHFTGDISGWWDHSFSEKPFRLFIEARPGGGFYEYFDSTGNGVLHATVIAADRGRLLRLDGPLGLAGKALNLVCTMTFSEAAPDTTKLVLEVHGSGEIGEGIPEMVEQVWNHFVEERFIPYATEKHLSVN
ncbi:MAG: hypothetical protein ACOYXB_06010 [Bacteroidota bacterium]